MAGNFNVYMSNTESIRSMLVSVQIPAQGADTVTRAACLKVLEHLGAADGLVDGGNYAD